MFDVRLDGKPAPKYLACAFLTGFLVIMLVLSNPGIDAVLPMLFVVMLVVTVGPASIQLLASSATPPPSTPSARAPPSLA
jgi:hypothetical protein